MQITSGKIAKAQKVVIYGPEGIGKTLLASKFPNPLFLDTEGSTTHYDVRRIAPAPTSWSMLIGYIDEVKAQGAALCQTLVLDTADWAERLCFEHVLSKYGVSGIEEFGWGKGYTYVKEEFARLLDKLSDLIDSGINIVACAHAQIKKFEQPDELGTYDRWELKLDKRNAPLLKEWADMLLFLNYENTIVKPDQKTGGHAKAVGGKRVMFTEHTPAWDAKNRVGLPAKAEVDYAVIAPYIPLAAQQAPTGIPKTLTTKEQPSEPAAESAPQGVVATASAPSTSAHLKPLYDLMASDSITENDLMAYCAKKGYCPPDTPVVVYPEDFVAFIVSDWPAVKKDIKA